MQQVPPVPTSHSIRLIACYTALWRHPRATLLLAAAALVWAATQIPSLTVDTSADAFINSDNPALIYKSVVKQTFGLDDPLVVAIHSTSGAMTESSWNALTTLSHDIRKIPNVDPQGVTSLATESFIYADEEGAWTKKFAETENMARLHQAVQTTPAVQGRLVSATGDMALILVELVDPQNSAITYQQIVALGAAAEQANAGTQVYVAGQAAVSAYLSQYIDDDARRVLPLTALAIALVLGFAFRTVKGVLIPLSVATATLACTFAAMAALQVPVYLITNGLAAILLAISVADAVHIVSHYQHQLVTKAADPIAATMRTMLRPITLTTLTTMAGFLGVCFGSSMPPMQAFGAFAMLGVAIAWLLSVICVPALLKVWPTRPTRPTPLTSLTSLTSTLPLKARHQKEVQPAKRQDFMVLALALALFVVGLTGARAIEVNDAEIEHFQPEEAIVTADRLINQHMFGTNLIDIVVRSEQQDGLLEPKNLNAIAALRQFAEAQPAVGGTSFFSDTLATLYHAIDPQAASPLPTTADGMAQLLLMYSSLEDPAVFRRQIDSHNQQAILRLYLNSGRYTNTAPVIQALEHQLQTNFDRQDLSAQLSGRVTLNYHWVTRVFHSHILSLTISGTLLLIISAWLFRSITAGLLVMTTVIAAVTMVYAIMGYGGFWLNAGTSMFAAIALGIGVDFGIHLLSAVQTAAQRHPFSVAIRQGVGTTRRALTVNAVALCAGFLRSLPAMFRKSRNLGFWSAALQPAHFLSLFTACQPLCGNFADSHSPMNDSKSEIWQQLQPGGGMASLRQAFNDWARNLPGRRVGRYRIGELVAQDAMSQYFDCLRADGVLDRTLTMQIVFGEPLSAAATTAFNLAVKQLQACNHPNLNQLIEGGITYEGFRYLTTELTDGISLNRYCELTHLPLRKRLELFYPLLDALDYAHQHGLVHGDLTPATVQINRQGHLKLLRCGHYTALNVQRWKSADNASLSPNFSSPEQLLGQPVTHRSDIFQVGMLLLRTVFGQHALEQKRLSVAVDQAVRQTPSQHSLAQPKTMPRATFAALRSAVLHCTRSQPIDRIQNAAQLKQLLEQTAVELKP